MRTPAHFRFALILTTTGAALAVAQAPPQPLPASITGQVPTPAAPVQPAAGIQVAPSAPITRFQDFNTLPPETVQAVYAMRGSADWLWRMNQPNGRFLSGLNPALKLALPEDPDTRQALAVLGLARAARFTGDERFTARAAQAVLAMLSLTKPDAGVRVPTAPPELCNRIAFASALALAVYELPAADAKLTADADALVAYVRKCCQADGSIQGADTADTPEAPGLALQALTTAFRRKADPATRTALGNGLAFYIKLAKTKPSLALSASLLPAITDAYLQTKDPGLVKAGFELADGLMTSQFTRAEARQSNWIGGFYTGTVATATEPRTAEAVLCTQALAAAATLARNAPDLTRYPKYRQGCINGLLFLRGLQFTDDNTDHFEKTFRLKFLAGGVRLAPTDAAIRADVTAGLVSSCVRFLESGAETRGE